MSDSPGADAEATGSNVVGYRGPSVPTDMRGEGSEREGAGKGQPQEKKRCESGETASCGRSTSPQRPSRPNARFPAPPPRVRLGPLPSSLNASAPKGLTETP